MPQKSLCSHSCRGCGGCSRDVRLPHPGTVPPSGPAPSAERTPQQPVQLGLAPLELPCYRGAHLLIAGACTAVASQEFHQRFLKNRVVLLTCPALDTADRTEKLARILRNNAIRTVTILRMENACCGETQRMVRDALRDAEKFIPWQMVTLSADGSILE